MEANSRTQDDKTWELRLLTTPVVHYKPASKEVLEGALFAMVSSAGTDPEIFLMIEARHPAAGGPSWAWHAAALRLSDKDLTVKRNDKVVWSSLDDAKYRAEIKNSYTLIQTPDMTYSCFLAHKVPELPDARP